MSAKSNWAENLALVFMLSTGSIAARPTAWYLGVYTAAPSDTGGGTEVSGSGYARQQVTFTVSNDTASNSGTETFTASGGNWGTITHFGIFDAVTTGNLIYWGSATASRTINDGESLTVADAAIVITEA